MTAARSFRFRRVEGAWFRLVRGGHDAMDFARTKSAGGRYNPPDAFPTLYLGDQPATCLLQVLVHAGQLESAYDVVPVAVRLPRVADLVSPEGMARAGVALDDLVAPPEPLRDDRGNIAGLRYGVTWELGRRAHETGADGLVVPSAAVREQAVLVLFDRPERRGRARALERRRLPVDPRVRREPS